MTTWQPGQPVTMETERFLLRSLTPEDVDETYLGWWNDAEIQKGFGMQPRGWTLADAIEHVKSFDNIKRLHLGIYLKESGRLIGFYSVFIDPEVKTSKANICIGEKDWQRRGVTSEIGPRMLQYRFEDMGHNLIVGKVVGNNVGAIELYKKHGFRLVKTKPDPNLQQDGRPLVTSYFMLTREEWFRQQSAKKKDAS